MESEIERGRREHQLGLQNGLDYIRATGRSTIQIRVKPDGSLELDQYAKAIRDTVILKARAGQTDQQILNRFKILFQTATWRLGSLFNEKKDGEDWVLTLENSG